MHASSFFEYRGNSCFDFPHLGTFIFESFPYVREVFLKKNCPPTVGKLCFEFVRGYGQRFVYVTVVLNFDRFFVFSPPHAQITMSIFIATCVIVEPGTKYAKNSNS